MAEMADDDDVERDVRVHLHLDAITINVVHTITADAALKQMFQSFKEEILMALADVNSAIVQLQADVTADETAEAGAITLIQGFGAQLAAAVAAATAAGATPAQLQSFSDLSTSLEANTAALAAAVAAGTQPPPASVRGAPQPR